MHTIRQTARITIRRCSTRHLHQQQRNYVYPYGVYSTVVLAVKLSGRLGRRCFHTSTRRWSNFSPRKVLCNTGKCALFERTRSRPRSEQFQFPAQARSVGGDYLREGSYGSYPPALLPLLSIFWAALGPEGQHERVPWLRGDPLIGVRWRSFVSACGAPRS